MTLVLDNHDQTKESSLTQALPQIQLYTAQNFDITADFAGLLCHKVTLSDKKK
ncbi:hypothetical protein [Nostoc sp.]|uniref:hypothetical protein n=1 Tax=Nostoc sp. TaxID=1180 RepID=UPI002FF71822